MGMNLEDIVADCKWCLTFALDTITNHIKEATPHQMEDLDLIPVFKSYLQDERDKVCPPPCKVLQYFCGPALFMLLPEYDKGFVLNWEAGHPLDDKDKWSEENMAPFLVRVIAEGRLRRTLPGKW